LITRIIFGDEYRSLSSPVTTIVRTIKSKNTRGAGLQCVIGGKLEIHTKFLGETSREKETAWETVVYFLG
jgi:hypothetical protein